MSAQSDEATYYRAYWSRRFNPKAFARRVRALHKNYAKHLPTARDASIVEIGPGFGELLAYLARSGYTNAIALDNDATLVMALQSRGFRGACHVGEVAGFLRDRPGHFDCAIALHVLEHLDADAGASLLRAIAASLKPGGTVILEVPNMANFITAPYARWADYTHRHGYTRESLDAALRATGLDVIDAFGVRRAIGSPAELLAYAAQGVTDLITWVLLKANYPQAWIITAPAIAVVGRRPVPPNERG